MKDKQQKRLEKISVAKAVAYATSTSVMILTYIVLGYVIGKNWGDAGAGIGVTLGGLLGLFSILIELVRIGKKFKDKDNEDK